MELVSVCGTERDREPEGGKIRLIIPKVNLGLIWLPGFLHRICRNQSCCLWRNGRRLQNPI